MKLVSILYTFFHIFLSVTKHVKYYSFFVCENFLLLSQTMLFLLFHLQVNVFEMKIFFYENAE